MRTFNKIMFLGLVLVSFIFTCSTFPCFTGTSASLSDVKYTSAEITVANLIGSSDLSPLESVEELQRTAANISGIDHSPDDANFSLDNGSSADNLTNGSLAVENETTSLNRTVNLTEASENSMGSGFSSKSADQDKDEDNPAQDSSDLTETSEDSMGSGSEDTPTDQDEAENTLPVAGFGNNLTSGYAPLAVQFTDLSENATGWDWDFGDGATSAEQNPVHIYHTAGNYTARLTVSSAEGTNSTFSQISVMPPAPPVANFSSNLTSGYAPLTVQFTDLSENITGWNWDFGDGATSTDQYPVHIYLETGNYTAGLTVSNAGGTNSTFSQITVMPPAPPVANFSSNITSGYAPLTVQFTDFSENAAERNWNFGDGTTSNEQNPVHTYFTAGNYTAGLTVSSAEGTNSTLSAITVLQPLSPVANFSSNITSGYAPLTVQFTDFSENAAERNWDFGDGVISNEQNPVHTYFTAGNYTVTLIATGAGGQNIKIGEISVFKDSIDYTGDKNFSTEIEK